MKRYLTILIALLVTALFTAVNVSAYDYIYGDIRPDDSFYFTTPGAVDGSDYAIGDYITGVKDVVAGDVIEFDVNMSGIPDDAAGGYKGAYWDFLYTNNLDQTMYAKTYTGDSVTNPWSDWAFYHNPDTGIWIDEGYSAYDESHLGKTGDVALMQINMTAEATFNSLLPEADGAVDLVWHWKGGGTSGDVIMEDGSYYNIVDKPETHYFAHHDLPGFGDCRLLINPVPIPGALWLLGSGLFGILGIRRAKNKSRRL